MEVAPSDALGDMRPTYPPYAVWDLGGLSTEVPREDRVWRDVGSINIEQARGMRDNIKTFLKMYSDLQRPGHNVSTRKEQERVSTLFVGDDPEEFLKSASFVALRKSVLDCGVLILDTEFASAETMKKMGCRQAASSGTIDLFQLGSLSGHAALLQVQYDCREAHGCVCDKECTTGKCELNFMTHEAWENQAASKNYGVKVPEEIVGWLKDASILKIQSQIVRTDGAFGDIERLENMLNVQVKSFVELQNLTMAWFPKGDSNGQKKSSNAFLAEQLGITNAAKHYKKVMKREVWSVNRRKPISSWSAALRFYDLADVMMPAVFLLQIGIDVIKKERTTCSTTNIIPYIRQMLLVLKNEPSLAVNRKGAPLGKFCPYLNWRGYDYRDVERSSAKSFPW